MFPDAATIKSESPFGKYHLPEKLVMNPDRWPSGHKIRTIPLIKQSLKPWTTSCSLPAPCCDTSSMATSLRSLATTVLRFPGHLRTTGCGDAAKPSHSPSLMWLFLYLGGSWNCPHQKCRSPTTLQTNFTFHYNPKLRQNTVGEEPHTHTYCFIESSWWTQKKRLLGKLPFLEVHLLNSLIVRLRDTSVSLETYATITLQLVSRFINRNYLCIKEVKIPFFFFLFYNILSAF